MAVLGGAEEEELKTKAAVKREQKKLREGKTAKAPGLGGGQRVVDTTAESLRELEVIEAKKQEVVAEAKPKTKPVKVRSKIYRVAKAKVDSEKKYSLPEAIKLLRKITYSKTNNTVELHLTLKEKEMSSEVTLPFSSGQQRRIAIADAATLKQIASGKIDFDVLYASPAQMPQLVQFAKLLGPRGLMPNPKAGTVVADPEATAAKLASQNTISLKADKDGWAIHLTVGKLGQPDSELVGNIQAVLASIPTAKVSKVVLKSTMSPAIKILL